MTNDSRKKGVKNRGERKEYKQKKQEYKQKTIESNRTQKKSIPTINTSHILVGMDSFSVFWEKQLSISRLPLIGPCAENIGTLVGYHQLEIAFF